MIYNPLTLRWEGNENTLQHFDMPPPLETPTPTGREQSSYMDRHHGPSSSPPRPALIAPMSTTNGVQVNGGMVFDPRQMKWLKLKEGRDMSGPLSPSITDGEEEDAFAGIDDLKDENSPLPGAGAAGMASPVSMATAPGGAGDIHEEFDLGPRFIETQQNEEAAWRMRCAAWFVDGEPRQDDGRWRWAIRDLASVEAGAELVWVRSEVDGFALVIMFIQRGMAWHGMGMVSLVALRSAWGKVLDGSRYEVMK